MIKPNGKQDPLPFEPLSDEQWLRMLDHLAFAMDVGAIQPGPDGPVFDAHDSAKDKRRHTIASRPQYDFTKPPAKPPTD